MKKKTAVILLALLAVTGSIVTFYATNLLFSDLSNMFYGVHDAYIIASIPLFTIALDFTAAFIFVMRYYRYPEYKKAMIRLYTIYLMAFSFIGLVFSVLTGVYIYHSFTVSYPIFCYPLMMLLVSAVLFAAGLVIRLLCQKKMPEDPAKRHYKVKYILYSIMLSLLTYYAFDKFGALIFAPAYAQVRTLYLTFPFYLSMLLPMALLIHIIVYFMDGYVGREKAAIRIVIALFFLNLIAGIAVFLIGANNTTFISAVSPALAMERLAAFPINTVFQFVVMTVMTIYYLIYALITLKKAKKSN